MREDRTKHGQEVSGLTGESVKRPAFERRLDISSVAAGGKKKRCYLLVPSSSRWGN